MAEIAEAYFHLKPFELQDPNLDGLGSLASSVALDAARSTYPPGSELVVRLSAGSLKGWAKIVVPAMFVTYGTVANYKGFKESVCEMVDDARWFAAKFNDAFISTTHTPKAAVFRTERRTKTPGKLLRAGRRLEWLEQHQTQLSKSVVRAERDSIQRMLAEALQDLSETDQSFVKRVLNPEREDAPTADESRVAIRREIFEQLPLFVQDATTDTVHPPDYFARFHLDEVPNGGDAKPHRPRS